MTLPFSRDEVCAVCGAVSEQTGVLSTITFGPPDLDGRPAPLKRATIEWAIHRCPNGGYCWGGSGGRPALCSSQWYCRATAHAGGRPFAPTLSTE